MRVYPVLRGLSVTVAAFAVGACGTSPDGDPLSTAESAALPSDAAIAALLYSGEPRVPSGFLDDPPPSSFAQVTTYHVKSSQLDAAATSVYEVCSDDWAEALAWSETLALQAPTYLDLVSNEQTAGYFEFDRVPQGAPEQYVRMRVFRCSYLVRDGVDLMSAGEFAGTLKTQPLDADSLRGVVEYLWHFTPYNNADHAVLASEPRAAAGGIAHALTLASLERAPDSAGCDRVVLREWTHALDVVTGAMRAATTTLREFRVRRDAGIVTIC